MSGTDLGAAGTARVYLHAGINPVQYAGAGVIGGLDVTLDQAASAVTYAAAAPGNQFDTIELTVQLAAGANTITFGNPGAYAPNIDKITVAPAILP